MTYNTAGKMLFDLWETSWAKELDDRNRRIRSEPGQTRCAGGESFSWVLGDA